MGPATRYTFRRNVASTIKIRFTLWGLLRNRSASLQKGIIFSRPQTSLSSGSAVMSIDARRRSFRSPSHTGSAAGSRTSTKKLIFTPPGVSVGPTDARDEVMEEIVNKPLTHTPTKVKYKRDNTSFLGVEPFCLAFK